MDLFDFLLGIYIICTVLCIILYLPRLRCWLYARYKQPRLHATVKRNLAIIIPARNESASIGALLDSIDRQTYPKEHFGVHVIVKEPDDPTIGIAEAAGAQVHVVQSQTCKGDALDGCLKKILTDTPTRYDEYIIVDADCVLDEKFLEEMNNAAESGAEIVTTKKKVKNYFYGSRETQPLSACCNGIIWTLMDNMGNAAKTKKGLPCFVVGTGLMLRADIVRQNGGWPYRATVTEDVELQHDTVLQGWRTFYYQYAVLYMEESTSHRVTNKRRRRWMTGVVDSKRLYAPKIAADPRASRRYRAIYHTRNLWIAYLLVGISTLFCIGNAISAILLSTFRSSLWFPAARNAVIGFLAVYAMFFIMTAVALFADWENVKIPFYRKIALLFVHPFFYMEYIPIVGMALFTGYGRKWDAIDRVSFAEGEGKS